MTELTLKIIEENPDAYNEASGALEFILKDMGGFPDQIREHLVANLPPPPTPPEERQKREELAAELERLRLEEEAKARGEEVGKKPGQLEYPFIILHFLIEGRKILGREFYFFECLSRFLVTLETIYSKYFDISTLFFLSARDG